MCNVKALAIVFMFKDHQPVWEQCAHSGDLCVVIITPLQNSRTNKQTHTKHTKHTKYTQNTN